MKISLHHQFDALRVANNFFPRADGVLYTRPAALQAVEGDISHAVGWSSLVLMELNGRTVLWDGSVAHDLGQIGMYLQAMPAQVLIGNGVRENRLYVADGVNPLWYTTRRENGTYLRNLVVNTIKDETNFPYPIPVPRLVTYWQNRLWIVDKSNRLFHSQNDALDTWDPLWSIETQGPQKDIIRSIKPHGEMLVIGLDNSIYAVTGTSQYNWKVDELRRNIGATGAESMVSHGGNLFHCHTTGLFLLGSDEPLTDDLRVLFEALPFGSRIVVDNVRRLLFLIVTGRIFVCHLNNMGSFTEMSCLGARGIVSSDSFCGWYGSNGLWFFSSTGNSLDYSVSGDFTEIECKVETWDQRPRISGSGRSLLNRAKILFSGPKRNTLSYTAKTGSHVFKRSFSSPTSEDIASKLPDAEFATKNYTPTLIEFSPKIAGQTFTHSIEASSYVEIHGFEPEYR